MKIINNIINKFGSGIITVLIFTTIINFGLSYYYISLVTKFYNTYIFESITQYGFNSIASNILYLVLISLYLFIFILIFLIILGRVNLKNRYLFALSNLNIYLLIYVILGGLYLFGIINLNFIGFYFFLLPVFSLFLSFFYSADRLNNEMTQYDELNKIGAVNKKQVLIDTNDNKTKENDIGLLLNKIDRDFSNKEKKQEENKPFEGLKIEKLGEEGNHGVHKIGLDKGNTSDGDKSGLINGIKGFFGKLFTPEDDGNIYIPNKMNSQNENSTDGGNINPLDGLFDKGNKKININDDLFNLDNIDNVSGLNDENINDRGGINLPPFDEGGEGFDINNEEDNRSIEEKLDLDNLLSTDAEKLEEVLGDEFSKESDSFLLDEDDEDFIRIEEKKIGTTSENDNHNYSEDENINPTKFYLQGLPVNKTQDLEKIEEYIYKL